MGFGMGCCHASAAARVVAAVAAAANFVCECYTVYVVHRAKLSVAADW
jgi:hypothetical protein